MSAKLFDNVTSIVKQVASGNVFFYNGTTLLFSVRETKEVRRVENRLYISLDNGSEIGFDVTVLTLIQADPTRSMAFSALDPQNVNEASYLTKVNAAYEYLTEEVFIGCCRSSGPTIVGGLLVPYPDYAALIASSPGSAGVLYLTEDSSLVWWWDGSQFLPTTNVLYFADRASFPVSGIEKLFYYAILEEEMFVWENGLSDYKSLLGVEGVTGNIVDNTDPQNPVVTQVQANWNEVDNTDPSFIQNKPSIPVVPSDIVETVSGNIVDNTDPANPVVDQLQADWTQSDNTQPDFIKNKPTIPTGTVESVTGDSVDNTDPDNPVVNAIPLAGTTTGNPVTGPIQGPGLTLIDDITDPTTFTSELQVGADVIIRVSDIVNAYNTRLFIGNGFVEIRSGDPVFEGITYGADYSANFVLRSLVDLGYVKGFIWQANAAPTATDDSNDEFEVGTLWVDRSVSPAKLYVCTNATVGAAVWQSIIPNITSGTAPPSGGNDGDIYLQYT
jgi:hypothetical protein